MRVMIILVLLWISALNGYDLTVVGQVRFAASLSRISLGIIECLKDDLAINVIPTPGDYDLTDVPASIRKIVDNPDRSPGRVSLFTDILWHAWGKAPSAYVPQNSIKIAYSMIEGTKIPQEWVTILNMHFDAVVVPDIFCKNVYKSCGVLIPIFVIPCGMCSEELFERPLKTGVHKPFTFGISAEFVRRKNVDTLIEAFMQEFGNNPQVRLRIHGRGGDYFPEIEKIIKRYKLSNVELINKRFTRAEYVDFLLSLDCYVLLSKGEGFSLTPREALALGIPCILSNVAAQGTICKTGFVKSVPAPFKEPAFYWCFNKTVGYYSNCSIKDVCSALREVYEQYDQYLMKAHKARPWVKQYLYKNLKEFYLTLIKPEQIELATDDSIEGRILKTSSKKLYSTYNAYLKKR